MFSLTPDTAGPVWSVSMVPVAGDTGTLVLHLLRTLPLRHKEAGETFVFTNHQGSQTQRTKAGCD